MKNLYLLPTDKPSRLGYLTKKGKEVFKDLRFFNRLMPIILDGENQNIYITNDEKIKVGDYYLCKMSMKILKCNGDEYFNNVDEKKIILTTDEHLIQVYDVHRINDDFLECFVKNSSCENVKIDLLAINEFGSEITVGGYGFDKFIYKAIVPKDGLKSECLLEEFIYKVPKDFNIKQQSVVDMCMKEQDNIILTYHLGNFIEYINSLPLDTEKSKILKSVFNNIDGELLLKSYNKMKKYYEK